MSEHMVISLSNIAGRLEGIAAGLSVTNGTKEVVNILRDCAQTLCLMTQIAKEANPDAPLS